MDIKILTHRGIHYSFKMNENSELKDLKIKIKDHFGIDFQEQTLLFNNDTMDIDYKKLQEYGLKHGSSVKLIINVIKENFKISVSMEGGQYFDIEVGSGDTLINVKNKIQQHCNLSAEDQILFHLGTVLEGNDTISSYGVQENSVVHVLHRLVNGLLVFVRPTNDAMFAIEVRESDKIINIKKKIQEKIGIPPEEHNILFDNEILEDDKIAGYYKIVARSAISIAPRLRQEMQILSRTMDGKTVAINVTKSDKIFDVKQKIHEKLGLPSDEQRLVYQDITLEDDKTVDDYNIVDNSVIDVVTILRNGIQIFAKTKDGKTIAFEVTKSDRIIDVKKKIQERLGLSPDEPKLVYQGGILADDKTVDYCGIVDKSVINVVVRLRGGMRIFGKTMDGKTVAFEVTKSDTMLNIKKKIQEKTGLGPDEQRLVYNGVILEDDKTVDDYNIVEKSVISVMARLRCNVYQIFDMDMDIRPMQISAKTMDGNTISFEVFNDDRIIDIKKKIQEKMGLSPDKQRLVYQGGILEDDKTVDYYGIVEKSVINIETI